MSSFHHLKYYICIGCFCIVIENLTFYIFRIVGLEVILSNSISILFGIIFSFIANSFLNFKKTDRKTRRLTKFLIITISGMTCSNILITELILHTSEIVAKLLSTFCIASLQFSLNFFWTFRTYKSNTSNAATDPD